MLVLSELGFRNWAYLFCFSFGLIVSFVIRWKWNKGVQRQKEVMRLMAMAAEEAARAELETKAEYYYYNPSATTAPPPPVSLVQLQHKPPQCVVCYSPTTNRCARCKAVRYCSGKCQIIHWRQGHKNECYPSKNTYSFKDPEGDTDQKAVPQRYQNEVYANGVENKESGETKSLETHVEKSSESKPSPDEPFVDASVSEVPTSSTPGKPEKPDARAVPDGPLVTAYVSELPASSIPNELEEPQSNDVAQGRPDSNAVDDEPLASASVSSLPASSTPSEVRGPQLNDDITQCGHDTEADAKDTKVSKLQPLDYNTLDASVNSITQRGSNSPIGPSMDDSKASKQTKPSSDFWEGAFESNGFRNDVQTDSSQSSVSRDGDHSSADTESPLHFSNNLFQQDASYSQPRLSKPKNALSVEVDPVIIWNKSSRGIPISERIQTDVRIEKNSSKGTEKPVSVDNVSSDLHVLCSRGAGSLFSGASGANINSGSSGKVVSNVESSAVRKVVQHFKVYKVSKHHTSGFGFESAEKNKMLFPYELFVKLYHWDKVELHPCGLTNSGNSCYANVVLQCLAFTRPLTAYLLQGFHSTSCPKKEWCFMCEFELFLFKAKEGKSPSSPTGMLSQLHNIGCHLGHGRQEDAHEFLRYVIDTMQSVCLKEAKEVVLGPSSEETTLIGYIFGGYLRSKITCMKCHGKSERNERMLDLTVEIHGNITTLEEALKKFTSPEILDGENKYECLRCRSQEKAKKKLTILEAPNVLTIALKRFQSGDNSKLNKPVQFPEFLNLAPYMSGTSDRSPIYRLYAVVVHKGTMNGTLSGHYVCYVRTIQGKWFNIDDSIVKPVELDKVLSEEAYMLLYSRRSPRAPRLIVSPPETKWAESSEDYTHWFHPSQRIPRVESVSETSSVFSNSDEGSFSTVSTRDSCITDDFSDSWNSPSRGLDGWQEERSVPVLSREYININSNVNSNNTNGSNSSSDNVDTERLGWDVNSGVSQRRFTQERTVQTFY